MQEFPYAKEPFDMKLFVLLFIKKIWLILMATVIGAVAIGGGYYLKKVVFRKTIEYTITSTYYVQYNNMDPVTGEMFNYTNAATWDTLIVSDQFVEKAWSYALEAGWMPENYGVEKSDLKDYFAADLPTDVRIPTSTVKTPYKEVTEALNKALQLTYQDLGKERTEMDSIVVIDETPLAIADNDIRTVRAIILGAVIGFVVAGFGIAFRIIWDDSVRIPESFTYRYGIPMTGYVAKGTNEFSKETLANIGYLFKEKQNNVLLTMGAKAEGERILKGMPKGSFQEVAAVSELEGEKYEKLRRAEGVLLVVEAGTHGGKEMEHVLHDLSLQDCQVTGALLCNADSRLIRCYRFGRRG